MELNIFESIIPIAIFLVALFATTILVLVKDHIKGGGTKISGILLKVSPFIVPIAAIIGTYFLLKYLDQCFFYDDSYMYIIMTAVIAIVFIGIHVFSFLQETWEDNVKFILPLIHFVVALGTYILFKYLDKVYFQVDNYMYIIATAAVIVIHAVTLIIGEQVYETEYVGVVLSPAHILFVIGTYILLNYLNIYYFLLDGYISLIATALFAIIYYSICVVIADISASDIDDHIVSFAIANILPVLASGGLIAIFTIAIKNYSNSFLIFYPVIFVLMLLFPVLNIVVLEDGIALVAEDVSIPVLVFDLILEVGLIIAYGVLIITVFTSMWALCFIPFGLAVIAIVSVIVAGMSM